MEALKVNDILFKGDHSKEEVLRYYDNWARTGKYDVDISAANGYRGPEIAAKTAAALYETNDRSSVKLLDVAAGTGHVGEELRKFGFEYLDALDTSESMLEQAKKKNLYNNYICDYLNETTMTHRNGFYDCITTSGGFGKGHIPAVALYDLIRLTKKGGHVIIVMREEYIHMPCYMNVLEPLMKKLEDEKKWKMIQRSVIPEYFLYKSGLLYVFQI